TSREKAYTALKIPPWCSRSPWTSPSTPWVSRRTGPSAGRLSIPLIRQLSATGNSCATVHTAARRPVAAGSRVTSRVRGAVISGYLLGRRSAGRDGAPPSLLLAVLGHVASLEESAAMNASCGTSTE